MLRQLLPAKLAARIDFASLALRPGSYVDDALKERSSDLLFGAQIGGRPALVYILFEHQSTADGRMSFRLLRYMVRVWERWERDAPSAAKLPMILPVVLHHSEEGWSGGTAFEDLLDVDEDTLAAAAPFVPRFRFVLEDISRETDEALRARAMTALATLVLWCLRHAREPEVLVERLGAWMDLVREVRRAPDGAAAWALARRRARLRRPAPPARGSSNRAPRRLLRRPRRPRQPPRPARGRLRRASSWQAARGSPAARPGQQARPTRRPAER